VAKENQIEDNIPEFARRCWEQYQSATEHLRTAAENSLKFWVGGKHQWRDAEIAARVGNNRPWITINRCKPAIDQVENECRNNPPGPKVRPVGGGADDDGADILAGLIREYEYRSDAQTAYVTALRYQCAANAGVFELATEYDPGRSFQQRLKVVEAEDPAVYFSDPDARMACRQDAMWGGKIRVLSREKLIEEFGDKLKVLNRGFVDRTAGWMQSAVGYRGNQATINLWTGGTNSNGPYFVCEFYRIKIVKDTLTLYSDNVARYKDEPIPENVTPKLDDEGKPIARYQPRRKVFKYIVTALDEINKTEWPGEIIPHFWVMGPEIYIKGKLYRLSLIDGAIDAQRLLNYAATSAAEVTGAMTKSPWVGWLGQFDVQNAQGMNPWESSSTQVWAYLEVKPSWAINPTSQQAELLPAPQRNTWEAPIARLLELATFAIEAIKGATSVFFDPSVQSVRDAQSGEAIKALQSQTNIGTLNWQDNLHRAVGLSYHEAAGIMQKLYDSQRVMTIVRPDSKHEAIEINREFENGIDPATGKKGKENRINRGQYAVRATAGPNFETRNDQAVEALTEVFKVAPNLLNAPGVAPRFMRMVGQGSPEVEDMADMLLGTGPDGEPSPQQLRGQIQQLTASDQAKTLLIQKMQQMIQAKLPDLELRKFEAAIKALTSIRVAEINASKDADNTAANLDASRMEMMFDQAHDVAMQSLEHQHAADMLAAQPQPPEPEPAQQAQ
jgi:hypothetical protein